MSGFQMHQFSNIFKGLGAMGILARATQTGSKESFDYISKP